MAWPGAQPSIVRTGGSFAAQAPQQERSNEATAPPEPTPAQVEPVPADPHSPVADPSSPKLEAAPPSSPIIIISEDPTKSTPGEVVALSDSPIFHLIDKEES